MNRRFVTETFDIRVLILFFCTLGVTNGPASRNYELALGKDDTVVQVDGLDSPLITLQYGTVDCFSNPIGLSILILFVLVPDLVDPDLGNSRTCLSL